MRRVWLLKRLSRACAYDFCEMVNVEASNAFRAVDDLSDDHFVGRHISERLVTVARVGAAGAHLD